MDKRVALVTGASHGIGRAIALRLASEDVFVIVNYCGSEQSAKEVVDEIKTQGGDGTSVQCDVSDFTQCGQMISSVIEQYGRLDILVNNAGITKDNLLMKMSDEDFASVIKINLFGAFNTIKHCTRPMMKQRQGRIINISSVSGIIGNVGQANYSASKAGVIGLTKATAKELAARNITVNCIAPGFVDTKMTSVLPERVKEEAVAQIPLKRFGQPEEIAEAVAFLASEKAGYITGQVISVDGGIAM